MGYFSVVKCWFKYSKSSSKVAVIRRRIPESQRLWWLPPVLIKSFDPGSYFHFCSFSRRRSRRSLCSSKLAVIVKRNQRAMTNQFDARVNALNSKVSCPCSLLEGRRSLLRSVPVKDKVVRWLILHLTTHVFQGKDRQQARAVTTIVSSLKVLI